MAYGEDRIMRDSLGFYVLNALGERMRLDPERGVTAHDLFLRQFAPPRSPPAAPSVYIPGQLRKPSAPLPAVTVTAPAAPTPVGRGQRGGRGRTARRGQRGGRGRTARRGQRGGRGQTVGRGQAASRGPMHIPASRMNLPGGRGPSNIASAFTGTASFIPSNIDPALSGSFDNPSPFSGFMGPAVTGPLLPTAPSGFGGYNPSPNPNVGVPSGLQSSQSRPLDGFPLGTRPNRYRDEMDLDEGEIEDPWGSAQSNAHTSFGSSAAGPSGSGSYDYPGNDNYVGDGFGSSAAGPSGMNTHNSPLTDNDMGSQGFGSSIPPSGPAGNGNDPAPNITQHKTRGAAGPDNDVRRTALLKAGCPCKRCWVSWVKTPHRACYVKVLNCGACRKPHNQVCIWSDLEHIPAIRHIVDLHNIFLAWLVANPNFDFNREVLDRLNYRGVLKTGQTWPTSVPQEYCDMADAINALRLLDKRQR